LKNLEVLDLSHNVIGARGVEAIFQSKNLANLHTLELALNRVGDARPVPTFDAPIKRQWKRLGLSRNDVGYEHVDAILASEHLAGLQELDLTGHGKFSDCLSKFAHAKRFGSLRRFEHNCYTITTSYRTMSESPHMVNLTHLDLYRGHIEDLSAFDGLMKSDRAKKLEEISIRETFFKDSSAVALISRAKALPALKVLELSDTTRKSKPTFEDTKRLFSSELLKQLKKFHYYGDWGPEHTALLADSAELRWLEELSIRASKSFDDSAAKQLAASPHLKNLRVLDLSSTKIGDEGVIALAKSPNTKNLRVLNLLHTKITDVGVAALAKSPHMANLEELSLSGEVSVMTKDSTIALARSPYINKLTKLDL
ncbi:MAG: hypothetical protein VX475_23205, partial [Myxococcota bacterium]|nr:hypothetical protein [Myxococcota bacterium]